MATLDPQQLYLDGQRVNASSGEHFQVINPYDGSLLAEVQHASQEDVDRAVTSARQGQKAWAAMTGMQRSRIMLRAVALLRERNDELAELETLNTGKPIAETASVDVVTGADALEYYAGLAPIRRHADPPARKLLYLYPSRAAWRDRCHRRLELPNPDRLLESRAGARRRKRGRLQAQRGDSAFSDEARRNLYRSRAAGWRIQRGAWRCPRRPDAHRP